MKLVDIQTLSYEKAEIIEQSEGIALARIHDLAGSDPGNYFEILRVVSGEGGKPVYIMNLARPGLHEPFTGAAKVPISFDRMKEGFDKMVAELVNKKAIAQRAADEAAEKQKAAELKATKLADAGRIQREARAELKELIHAAADVTKLVDEKKIHKLLMKVAAAELIIQTLNSK